MYLKSLSIQGFKSFPDPIVIEFHEGITAIVGPNGSGKSNVTDAIRWVLGEQSARSLRGSKMEDIVFNGTENRRRMSYAEVSILFDNSDRQLALDFAEIEITRRYYRSGDSEYLINKVPCRLKDITNLFADTGIGRDGYSIIGQGRVDEILSERSEDKRRIFDEAAGIVKFKMRKQESERKLEKTDQNLLRLQDILGEVEKRLTPLQKQAETAATYRQLHEQFKRADINLKLQQIQQKEQEQAKLLQENEDYRHDLAQAETHAEALQAENSQVETNLQDLDRDMEELRQKQNRLQLAGSTLQERSALRRERLHSLEQEKSNCEHELLALAAKRDLLSSEQEGRVGKKERLTQSAAAYREQVQEEEAMLNELVQRLNEQEQLRDQMKQELDAKRELLFDLKQEQNRLQSELQFVRAEFKNLESENAVQQSEQNRLGFHLEDEREQLQRAEAELQEARAALTANESALNDCKSAAGKVDEERRELERRERELQYHLQTLRNLAEDHEGYHQAVRALMKAASRDPELAHGLHAPLGDLISVPKNFERAIEIALGNAVHNIVVQDRYAAERGIRWLKRERAGRETFLPLEHLQVEYLKDRYLDILEGEKAYLGLASDFVECEDRYRPALEFVLGKIVIAEDLDSAVYLSERCDKKIRVVSLDGDQINPGGSFTGGEGKQNSRGLLSRQRELKDLEQALQALPKRLQELAKQLDGYRDELLQLAAVNQDLSQKIREQESAYNEQQTAIKLAEEKQSQFQQRLSKLDDKKGLLTEQMGQLEAEVKRVSEAVDAAEVDRDELSRQLESQGASKKADYEMRDEIRENLADLRVSLGSVEESLHSLDLLNEQNQRELQHLDEQEKRNHERQQAIHDERQRITHEQAGEADERSALEADVQAAEAAYQSLLQDKEALNKARQDSLKQWQEAQELLRRLATRQAESEQRRLRGEEILREHKQYLWENWQLSYAEAQELRDPELNGSSLQKTVKDLRQAISALGPVNPEAEEEYRETAERFTYLSEQANDILQTRQELEKLISELEKSMCEQFLREFSEINRQFQRVFSELFGGGQAELSVDLDDPVYANIDIKAQPPGKRLQNLSLLSGGERSLTAIALVFAIFQLRPAPFCVLDEVESALDDANVLRFTEYIRHYTERTQFILVTHRKGTMESADRLYGVTMKERGVSSLLSMALDA